MVDLLNKAIPRFKMIKKQTLQARKDVFSRACYFTKDGIHYLAVASHSFFNLEDGKLTLYEIIDR